jgi:hypothetical protein
MATVARKYIKFHLLRVFAKVRIILRLSARGRQASRGGERMLSLIGGHFAPQAKFFVAEKCECCSLWRRRQKKMG